VKKYYVTIPYVKHGVRVQTRESGRNYKLDVAIQKASQLARGARVYALGTCTSPVYVSE